MEGGGVRGRQEDREGKWKRVNMGGMIKGDQKKLEIRGRSSGENERRLRK